MRNFLAITAVMVALPAYGQPLSLQEDHTQLLRTPAPVSEVIIGNPSIAEVTVVHTNLLALTGRSFGHTNIIVRDENRAIILDKKIEVLAVDAKPVVSLRMGAGTSRFLCDPRCNTMPLQSLDTDTSESGSDGGTAGGPCDSPNQRAKDGSRCGKRSAFDRAGGNPGYLHMPPPPRITHTR